MPAGTFGSISQALPHLMTTGEDYKIRKVSDVPRLKVLLEKGISYWEALRQIDL